MTTKFKANILKRGDNNNNLITIIAAHNGGEITFTIADLIGFGKAQKALFPASNKTFTIFRGDDDNLLYVSEDDGLTFTMTIEEITLIELKPEQVDDLKGINI